MEFGVSLICSCCLLVFENIWVLKDFEDFIPVILWRFFMKSHLARNVAQVTCTK